MGQYDSKPENLTHVVILDISGVYAQIYDQGYYYATEIAQLAHTYSDKSHWQLVVVTK